MKKRILALALALVLVTSMAVPALATGGISEPGTKDTTMTYNVASTYTVTIPATVTINAEKSGTLTVGVAAGALIPTGQSILVKLTVCDFKLTNSDDNLTYTITDDTSATVALDGTVLTHAAGTLTATNEVLSIAVTDNAKYSGAYTDAITFTVSVEATPA